MAAKLGRSQSAGFANAALVLVSLLYLFLIVPGPGIALPWMAIDDGLFFRWSVSIQQGQWLGPWDYLTTVKGPLHSLLSSWASGVGIGPFAYKRLLLLVGSLVFVFSVIRPSRPLLRVVLLLALLADPFQFGAAGLRNLREGTYLPLQMIALGLGCRSLDALRHRQPQWGIILASAIGMAFSFGLLLITREGWLIVRLEWFVWLALAALLLLQQCRRAQVSRRALPIIVPGIVLILLAQFLPVALLRSVNANLYGYPLANSLEEGGFGRFYGTLSSLRVRGDDRYIPRVAVKKKALDLAIEELSDQPSGLRRILSDINWADGDYGCRQYPETCNDMASGWLPFALRKSIVKNMGPKQDEAHFQDLTSRAEEEILTLCSTSARLECVAQSSGFFLKPSRWGYTNTVAEIGREVGKVLPRIFLPDPFPLGRPDLSRHTFLSPISQSDLERLGLRPIPEESRLLWQRIYVLISFIGTLLRWGLLLLAIVAVIVTIRYRGIKIARLDPAAIWLLLCVLIQSAIYVLIGLSSFPGEPYTILTAPIAVGFFARVIDSQSAMPEHRPTPLPIQIGSNL